MGIAYWLYQPEVWIILGIVLILAELTDGSAIFFLPFGLGALSNALLVSLQSSENLPSVLEFSEWWNMLISWALLAVVALGLLRLIFSFRRRKKDQDINEY